MKKKFYIFAIIFLILPGIFYFINFSEIGSHIFSLIQKEYNDCCKVKQINIKHDNLVDKDSIEKIINVKVEDSIFKYSVAEIKNLLENDSRISSAEVSLSLNGIIFVNVKSKIPKAILWDKGSKWYIDINGDIIRQLTKTDDVKQYIIIFGNNAANQLKQLLMLIEKFEVYKKIVSANFIGNRRWDLYLTDKTIIRLPEDNIESAFKVTSKLIKMPISDKKINIIDLRLIPNKIYIGLS